MTFLHKIAEVAELRNIDTFDLEWRKYEMIPPPEGAPEGTEAKKPEEFMHMYVRVTAAGKEIRITSYNVCYTKLLRSSRLVTSYGP